MKYTRGLLSLATVALLLSGCTAGAPHGPAQRQDTLTIAGPDHLENLDPANAFSGWPLSRNGVSETLIDVDEHLNLVPRLATAWKSLNPTTWQITLREGVRFSNGSPVDGAAVKRSLEHAVATNVRARSQLRLAGIDAQATTLTLRTTAPLGALPHILTDPMLGIQALGDGIDPTKKPVTTGPFAVEEVQPGQRMTLRANEHYWNGKPALKKVVVKEYSDVQAMGLAVQAGEADVVVRPDAIRLAAYADTSRYQTQQITGMRSDGIIVNTQHTALQDVRVRKAVNAALDRDGYASLMTGMAQPGYVFFPDNVTFGGREGLRLPVEKKDLSMAKQLLKEAGYQNQGGKMVKDAKPLTLKVLTYSKRPYLAQVAQLLQNDLRGIGVEVTITELKSSEEAMKAGDFDLAMYSMVTAPTGDPEYFFDTMLRSTSDSNYGRYKSATFDAALAALSKATTVEKRKLASRAAEQVLLDDMPYLMVGHQKWWVVAVKGVKNLSLRPTEYHLLTSTTSVEK